MQVSFPLQVAELSPAVNRLLAVASVEISLAVSKTLFAEPYLSTDPQHQGLILHSVYHRPNGWDYVPPGRKVPCGESTMWGDYHAIELAVYLKRLIEGGPYLTFFDPKE